MADVEKQAQNPFDALNDRGKDEAQDATVIPGSLPAGGLDRRTVSSGHLQWRPDQKERLREIIRIERDYATPTMQFWAGWPNELAGRISPTEHSKFLNEINEILASAHNPYKSIFDNTLAVLTLYASTYLYKSHYQKEMHKFLQAIHHANTSVYNLVGLNILNPERVAYLFVGLPFFLVQLAYNYSSKSSAIRISHN